MHIYTIYTYIVYTHTHTHTHTHMKMSHARTRARAHTHRGDGFDTEEIYHRRNILRIYPHSIAAQPLQHSL
jgi:hypothetical protein